MMQRAVSIALAAAARIGATGNSSAVDVSDFTGVAKFILNASPTEGAGMTLDAKIEHSADGSTNWTDAGIAFAQVTSAAASHQEVNVNIDQLKKFVRVVSTLAGASPYVTRAVSLVGQKAY